MAKRDYLGFPKKETDKISDKPAVDLDIFYPGSQIKDEMLFRKHLQAYLCNGSDDYDDDDDVIDGGCCSGGLFKDVDAAIDFEMETPVYSDEVDKGKFGKVVKGSTFDLLSLLSEGCNDSNHLVRIVNGESHGVVGVDSLKGKYVLLCCVFIPCVVNGIYFDLLHSLWLLTREMSARKDKGDVEMVLVVKVKPQWSHYPDVATHFVKHFSCLVVPFDHHARIDSICKAINLGCQPTGILVGPNQVVIQDTLWFVQVVGMDAFPFTDADIHFDQDPMFERKSLEQILGHTCVYRRTFSKKREVASTTDLGHKLVGLYLCITGEDMPMLRNVYHQCRAKGLEFEVVVLCMPFVENARPEALEQVMASVLKRSNLPWWVLPFNNSVFRRLFIQSCVDISDRLFIVLPNGKLMEPHGELVARHFGVDAYPFTRENLIKKALDKLRRLTLESSLLGGFLYRGRDKISVADIQGKNVILCLGSMGEMKRMHKLLIKNYSHWKAKDPDLEVVCACLDVHISDLDTCFLSSMPWLLYVRDPSKSEYVADDFNVWGMERSKLVAFGKDGRICSLDVRYVLREYGPCAFPFAGDLVDEIGLELYNKDRCFISDMVWSDRSSI